jgi:hypothetical protein
MRKSLSFALLVSMVGISLAMVGCADRYESSKTPDPYSQSLDSAARDMSGQEPAGTPFVDALLASDLRVGAAETPTINDLYSSGDNVYAVYDKGLMIYNLRTAEHTVVVVDDNLWTIAAHDDSLYVGGNHLYVLVDTELSLIEGEVPGQINELSSFGPSLMIGADSGLYARSLSQSVQLLGGVKVTSMVADGSALWVGTDGDGLYWWDGNDFQKRYLTRDSSLFDNVSALAFSHGHLYLGTDNGMFVYDGGRWETVSAEQGMPSDEIVSIDADGWLVYVGTAGGAVTWYQHNVAPVKHLNETIVTAFCRSGKRVVAATLYDGLAIKNGPAVSFVTAPWQPETRDLATTLQ